MAMERRTGPTVLPAPEPAVPRRAPGAGDQTDTLRDLCGLVSGSDLEPVSIFEQEETPYPSAQSPKARGRLERDPPERG